MDRVAPLLAHQSSFTEELDDQVEIFEERQEQLITLKEVLDISEASFDREMKLSRKFARGMLMYFAVIAGCELDIIAYVMTAPSHWYSAPNDPTMQFMIRCFITLGPLGYVGAALCYMYIGMRDSDNEQSVHDIGATKTDEVVEDKETGKRKDSSQRPTTRESQASTPNTGESQEEPVKEELSFSRKPVTLQLKHFCPVLRDMLLLQEMDPNDVECLFRVNALSSFTLGFSVCCSILLQVAAMQEPGFPQTSSHTTMTTMATTMTTTTTTMCSSYPGCQQVQDLNDFLANTWFSMGIFSQFNIFTQVVNVTITVLYFTTNIAHWMRAATQVAALKKKFAVELDLDVATYDTFMREDQTAETERCVQIYMQKCSVELQCFSGFSGTSKKTHAYPVWHHFEHFDLVKIRKFYHLKMVNTFAAI